MVSTAGALRRGDQGRGRSGACEGNPTGGLAEVDLDLLRHGHLLQGTVGGPADSREDEGTDDHLIAALPSPPRVAAPAPPPAPSGPTSTSTLQIWSSWAVPSWSLRIVAHPLRDGGRQRAVSGRGSRARLDHGSDQSGRTIPNPVGTTSNPVTLSTRRIWSSATTMWSSSAWGYPRVRRRRGHRSGSLCAAAGVGVPGQGLLLRGVVRGRRAGVRRIRPGAHGHLSDPGLR